MASAAQPVTQSPSWKKEAATAVGVLLPILMVFAGKVPPDSIWAALMTAAVAICTYVGGRAFQQGKEAQGNALVLASREQASGTITSEVNKENPTEP